MGAYANKSQSNQKKSVAIQAKENNGKSDTFQLAEAPSNKTGLPDNLKAGIENLSGLSMNDVKVHYNSGKPAQLQAHAYAQGTSIHVAPGQERHLPHEAWHVVQQKQGRVRPTVQMRQVNVNDDPALEKEADVMGSKAMQMVTAVRQPVFTPAIAQRKVVQKVDDIAMGASGSDLTDSVKRKLIIDVIYKGIEAKAEWYQLSNLATAKAYLKDTYSGPQHSQIRGAEDGKLTIFAKEILARRYHENTASGEITNDMRMKLGRGQEVTGAPGAIKDPDINASTVKYPDKKAGRDDFEVTSNMTTGKACVITALMFSEGGGVLGAKSVEELHVILSTRFGTTWRHYSDDAVYKSLYTHLGYSKMVPGTAKKLKDLSEAIGDYRHGMVSIGGHMIGFKKEGDTLHIRDNDEGLKTPAEHSKKNQQILAVWHK